MATLEPGGGTPDGRGPEHTPAATTAVDGAAAATHWDSESESSSGGEGSEADEPTARRHRRPKAHRLLTWMDMAEQREEEVERLQQAARAASHEWLSTPDAWRPVSAAAAPSALPHAATVTRSHVTAHLQPHGTPATPAAVPGTGVLRPTTTSAAPAPAPPLPAALQPPMSPPRTRTRPLWAWIAERAQRHGVWGDTHSDGQQHASRNQTRRTAAAAPPPAEASTAAAATPPWPPPPLRYTLAPTSAHSLTLPASTPAPLLSALAGGSPLSVHPQSQESAAAAAGASDVADPSLPEWKRRCLMLSSTLKSTIAGSGDSNTPSAPADPYGPFKPIVPFVAAGASEHASSRGPLSPAAASSVLVSSSVAPPPIPCRYRFASVIEVQHALLSLGYNVTPARSITQGFASTYPVPRDFRRAGGARKQNKATTEAKQPTQAAAGAAGAAAAAAAAAAAVTATPRLLPTTPSSSMLRPVVPPPRTPLLVSLDAGAASPMSAWMMSPMNRQSPMPSSGFHFSQLQLSGQASPAQSPPSHMGTPHHAQLSPQCRRLQLPSPAAAPAPQSQRHAHFQTPSEKHARFQLPPQAEQTPPLQPPISSSSIRSTIAGVGTPPHTRLTRSLPPLPPLSASMAPSPHPLSMPSPPAGHPQSSPTRTPLRLDSTVPRDSDFGVDAWGSGSPSRKRKHPDHSGDDPGGWLPHSSATAASSLGSTSPAAQWAALPPAPFAFFPWRRGQAHSILSAQRAISATTAPVASGSDHPDDCEGNCSDEDGEASMRETDETLLPSSAAAARRGKRPSRAPSVAYHHVRPLSASLRRFIQSQALAPLVPFASASSCGLTPSASSRANSVRFAASSQPLSSRAMSTWPLTPAMEDLMDGAEEERAHLALLERSQHKHMSTLPERSNDDGMVETSMDTSDGPTNSSQRLMHTTHMSLSSAANAAATSHPSISDPRLLLSFKDSPGAAGSGTELRSYPPAILNWWERAGGIRPFNPALAGAFHPHADAAVPSSSFDSPPRSAGLLGVVGGGGGGGAMHKHALFCVLPPPQGILSSSHAWIDPFFQNLTAAYQEANLGKHVNLMQHTRRAETELAGAVGREAQGTMDTSCILDVRFERPPWLQETPMAADVTAAVEASPNSSPVSLPHGGGPSPGPMPPGPLPAFQLQPHPSPPSRSPSPSPTLSAAPGGGVFAASSLAAVSATGAAPPRPLSPSVRACMDEAGLSHGAAPTHGNTNAASEFPPLLHVLPPSSGMVRWYQAVVCSLLRHLVTLVRARAMREQKEDSWGAMAPDGSFSGTSAAPLLDVDRFDCLLLYVLCPDTDEDDDSASPGDSLRHSPALLQHFLRYLTEPNLLAGEIERRRRAQEVSDAMREQRRAAGRQGSDGREQRAVDEMRMEEEEEESLAFAFPPSLTTAWSAALQSIGHLQLVVRFLPASSLTPLSPSNLRAHALSSWAQLTRPSERVTFLAAMDAPPRALRGSVWGAADPPLHLTHAWVEPLAVLARAHPLPPPPHLPPTSASSAPVLHLAYAFEAVPGVLLAAMTDERGVVLHSAIIGSEVVDDGATMQSLGNNPPAQLRRNPSLSLLLSRLLNEHVRPLVQAMARTMPLRTWRLVVAKLGSEWSESDSAAWETVAAGQGWNNTKAGKGDTLAHLVPVDRPASPDPAHQVSILLDVILLSCVRVPVPAWAHSAAPSPLPVVGPASSSSGRRSGASSSFSSSSSSSPTFSLRSELARARHSLASTFFSRSWWQHRQRSSASSSSPSSSTLPAATGATDGIGGMGSEDALLTGRTDGDEGALASRLYFPTPLPGASLSQQDLSAKSAALSAMQPPVRASLALQVSLQEHFAATAAPAATCAHGGASEGACARCADASPTHSPSAAWCRDTLSAILLQWSHLALLSPPAPRATRARAWTRAAGEPAPHLPMHITVLTRMHAMVHSL